MFLEFQAVIIYKGVTNSFERVPNRTIHWPNRQDPPPDTPQCGFDGSLCRKPGEINDIIFKFSNFDIGINKIIYTFQI